ncbi:MAG: hypothetical protein MZV64_16965 [Ignavibacteriales bacterium]|nr:hypothetical protein [Ignavibacteriales bacterium]
MTGTSCPVGPDHRICPPAGSLAGPYRARWRPAFGIAADGPRGPRAAGRRLHRGRSAHVPGGDATR